MPTPFFRRLAALGALALLAGCATPGAPQAPGQGVTAIVQRAGDDWTATLDLDRDAPVWAFMRSALLRETREPWRPARWTVRTPGVVLERVGAYDVLRRENGGPVPRRIEIALTHAAGDLEADYQPTLIFSDGSRALFSEQFNLIPLPSLEAARALPRDLNGVETPGGPTAVTWRDRGGRVLVQGRRLREATTREADTYVLFGDARVVGGEGVAAVVDPELPAWLGGHLRRFTPEVMAHYRERLGPAGDDTPMLMVAWNGPREGLTSMGGSVLPGLIVMSFEGEGVLEASPPVLQRAQWFIGHEAAHFWLGSNGLRYAFAREAWITEGGADLMAVRAMGAVEPDFDVAAELQREADDCAALMGRGVESAPERGEHRAHYACGALFWLALESWSQRAGAGDMLALVRRFRAQDDGDGILTRADWLAELTRLSGSEAAATQVARWLDRGAEAPAAELAAFLTAAGVAARAEGERLVLG
jgi:hypothetical protein